MNLFLNTISATPNTKTRFEANQPAKFDLSGKWETYFLNGIDSSMALGVFEKAENTSVEGNIKGQKRNFLML